MPDRPTDEVQRFLQRAKHWFIDSKGAGFKQPDERHIGNVIAGLTDIASALEMLALSLRATYILLEQVDRKLDKQALVRK